MDFEFKTSSIKGKQASYLEFNTEGIPAHFYGANGFPLGIYKQFISEIYPYFDLKCLSVRACWPNIGEANKQTNWEVYADDLIQFIEKHYSEAIVGMGHSQGATATLIAAAKRPDLFKSLILIEPASVTKGISLLIKYVPYFIKKYTEPLKSTLQKKDVWDNPEQFYEFNRKFRGFKRISDEVLHDFSEYGLIHTENNHYKLTFSSKWEASSYAQAPNIFKYIKKIQVPIKIIAGKPSVFFSEDLRKKFKTLSPTISINVNTKYGHLFPLEAPELCAKLVKDIATIN